MSPESASSVAASARRPVRILILALGGEGGGTLTEWLFEAARASGFPVQSTSIPGVAQRTGATSYYLELLPRRLADGEAAPVMCLAPMAGDLDLVVSSELLETARAIERGLLDPERTVLVSSTSRFLTVAEKMQMADGRFDDAQAEALARRFAQRAVLFDMNALAQRKGTVVSAVMLGAIAASGLTGIDRQAFEDVVRAAGGRRAEASLAGFAAGFEQVSAAGEAAHAEAAPGADPETTAVAELVRLAEARLIDYQDADYAADYRRMIDRIVALESAAGGAPEFAASRHAARFLALWMAYEDVIRVAELKSRPERFERIRAEVGARADEPIVVRDFLKPGVEEIAAILPERWARRLERWAERRGMRSFGQGMRLNTTSVRGTLMMRTLASMKRWRRASSRFAAEQALVARWFAALVAALERDLRLAREIAETPRLIKGYSDTHARGKASFVEILETLIEPALEPGDEAARTRAEAIRRAREAALADPEGRSLAQALGRPMPAPAERPIRFVDMKRR